MTDITHLTLAETLKKISKKALTIEEIHESYRTKIKAENDTYNIYLTLDETAKEQALALQDAPLKGIPVAVKDNFCTKGLRTTASSTVLDEFIPQFESTVTANLKNAGGTILGKTNMDAWAHGSSTETSQYGRTLNPRNPDYLPGGSSGGSAAAIAADLALIALGSETAGSIRQPSSWCGVAGLKPTYGRCSRYGVAAMASSTDSPGPIGKTIEDCAIMLNHIAGHDPLDGTSSQQDVPDFTANIGTSIKGMKIGYLYADLPGLEHITPLFESELKVLERLGAHVEPVKAIDPTYAIAVYTIVQRGEVSSNLARYDAVRYQHGREFFGDEAKRRIMLGTHSLSKGYADQYYNLAQKVRTLFINDFKKLFKSYDVLVSPTSPGFAKKIGATEGEAMFGELEDMLMEPSSLSGLPGASIPCYRDPQTNLYLGMNIMAPHWEEQRVVQVADAYEKATEWNSWR